MSEPQDLTIAQLLDLIEQEGRWCAVAPSGETKVMGTRIVDAALALRERLTGDKYPPEFRHLLNRRKTK